MQKRITVISGLSIVLFVFLVSTAMAAGVGTEAGNWEYTFDQKTSPAEVAAQNHQYDAETLAQVGSEAGNWHYDSNRPETKAIRAAENYQYDQEALAKVGSEAGDWQYSPADGAYNDENIVDQEESIANEGQPSETICKGC